MKHDDIKADIRLSIEKVTVNFNNYYKQHLTLLNVNIKNVINNY